MGFRMPCFLEVVKNRVNFLAK